MNIKEFLDNLKLKLLLSNTSKEALEKNGPKLMEYIRKDNNNFMWNQNKELLKYNKVIFFIIICLVFIFSI